MIALVYIIILLISVPVSSFSVSSQKTSIEEEAYYLEKGRKEKKAGDYLTALKTWEEARVALTIPSMAVAIEHIQLATEQELVESYQISSAMYYWALSAQESDALDADVIKLEMDMLEPLTDADTYKEWRSAFRKSPAQVLPLLQKFWTELDPTPNTPYNERLIEHWERISHVRDAYTLKRNSIYGTDDRGVVYVKYGEPNFVQHGEFNLTNTNVKDLVISRIQLLDPASRSEVVSADFDLGPVLDETFATAMEFEVFKYAGSRRYEVWRYVDHDLDKDQSNVFIFGDTAVKGFAEALTIDDFIPSSASTLSKRFALSIPANELVLNGQGTGAPAEAPQPIDFGITPAIIIQHEYLKQFSTIDERFANAYAILRENFLRPGQAPQKSQAFVAKSRRVNEARVIRNQAPKEVSTYLDDFPTIPVSAYSYRFIDEKNKPYSIVYMESQPQGSFIIDSGRNAKSMFDNPLDSALNVFSYYSFTHGAQVRDEDWRLMDTQKQKPEIIIDPYVQSPSSESVFIVPHLGEKAVQVFYAELKNTHPETDPYIDSPFPKSLRGIGSVKQTQGKPLNLDQRELEMSDIVFGHQLEENSDGILIPFIPLHSKEIGFGDNIAIHYELYHLEQGLDDISRFEIEFEITKKQRFLDRLRKDPPQFSLTLNQQVAQTYFKENLEVETKNLEQGSYTLRLTVKDTISNNTVERKVDFKVVDQNRR